MRKLLVILLLLITSLHAAEIKPIKKGETASFTGFLITPKFEKDRRKEREDLALEKRKTALLRELGTVKDRRVELWKKEAENVQKEYIKQRFKTILWFVGGILVGGASIYFGSKIR